MKVSSRTRAVVAVVVVLAAAVVLSVGCCAPQLSIMMMRPDAKSFDDEVHPPAPNYGDDDAWLALPSVIEAADVALRALPAVDAADAAVDVFFLHSTSSLKPLWNSPEDEEVRTASIRGGTLIQGSVFNGCCRVYAPTYRQASGAAFTEPSPSGEQAKDLAFVDVKAAFAEFRRRTGPRPFILAAHSQGSVLGVRLLREVIAPSADRDLLVAAYLIGAPIHPAELGDVPACHSPDATGCVVTYNARGKDHVVNPIDFAGTGPEAERVCVNPVLGAQTTTPSTTAQHQGAVFFDAEAPALLPHFAAAQCVQGRLVVTEMQPIPNRDAMSGILLWMMGGTNFHPIEYQLFYANLRADAVHRSALFAAKQEPPAAPAASASP
jgi:hypothetical protein